MGAESGIRDKKACIGLAAINVLIYICMVIGDVAGDMEIMSTHGAVFPPLMLSEGVWYPFVTAMFLHFDVEHLANNMIMLIAVGSYIEKYLGPVRFLIIYFLSGVAGNLLSFVNVIHGNMYTVSAGASGAVFGMVGALLVLAIKNRGSIEGLGIKRILFMIFFSLFSGLTSAGVDNWAHVGGLAAGLIFGFLLAPRIVKEE